MLEWTTDVVAQFGPWLVMAMTFMETALIVGLVVPAEPTIIIATALALQGDLALWQVIVAAVAGAALGDSTGFWIGRYGGQRFLEGSGRLSRAARKHGARADAVLDDSPGLAISVTRLVPFVRTLMPLVAGSTKVSYGRFLLFDALGVAAWAVGAIGIAYATALGWEWANRSFGAGMAVVLIGGLLLAGWRIERGVAERAIPTPPAEIAPAPDPPPEPDAEHDQAVPERFGS